MEDLLALVMVVAGVWAVYYACKLLWNKYQAHQTKKEIERVAEERRQIEATRKWRESRYQKQQVVGNGMAIQAGGNVSVGMSSSSSRVHSPSYAPSPTQSMQSYSSNDNLLSDLADIAIIANTFHHWNDNKKESSDAPVTSSSSSSSWGLDDSDSRRSASSTFSSSDSSSSWSSSSSDSSSSWSSSDSGPSSDW